MGLLQSLNLLDVLLLDPAIRVVLAEADFVLVFVADISFAGNESLEHSYLYW